MVDEIVRPARHRSFSRVRGLCLDYLDEDEDQAVRASALSPRSTGLRRLYFDFPVGPAGCKALAFSPYLGKMESLVLDYPPVSRGHGPALGRARWFRNLRRLQLWLGRGDVLRSCRVACHAAADVANATNAVHKPGVDSTILESDSFPRLAHLDLTDCSSRPNTSRPSAGVAAPGGTSSPAVRGADGLRGARHRSLRGDSPSPGHARARKYRPAGCRHWPIRCACGAEAPRPGREPDRSGRTRGPGGQPHLGLRAASTWHAQLVAGQSVPVTSRRSALSTCPELRT